MKREAAATLVWTRSRRDWDEDQKLFQDRESSFCTLHLPCLSFTAVKRERQFSQVDQLLSKGAPLLVVFTSAWGVHYAWENPYLRSHLTHASIYALGEGTSQALQQYGLAGRHPKIPRGGLELGQLIVKSTRGDEVVLLPGGVERAFDLRLYLSEHGLTAVTIDLYQSIAAIDKSGPGLPQVVETLRERLQQPGHPLLLCFASPTAVIGFYRGFAPLLRQETARAPGASSIALALGETTAQCCRQYFERVVLAPKPTLRALLAHAELLAQR